jgi:hypothetical protein
MRAQLYLTGAACAALMACSAADITGPGLEKTSAGRASDALTSQTNEQDVPWTWEGTNPCNGEFVAIEGTSHFIMHVTLNTGGLTPGFHLDNHVVSKGHGFDAALIKEYSGMSDETESFQVPDPTAVELFESKLQLRGPERGDDYFIHNVFKLTVNANGVPTAQFDKTKTRCN